MLPFTNHLAQHNMICTTKLTRCTHNWDGFTTDKPSCLHTMCTLETYTLWGAFLARNNTPAKKVYLRCPATHHSLSLLHDFLALSLHARYFPVTNGIRGKHSWQESGNRLVSKKGNASKPDYCCGTEIHPKYAILFRALWDRDTPKGVTLSRALHHAEHHCLPLYDGSTNEKNR